MLQDKEINSMVDFIDKKSAETLTTSKDDIRESMVKEYKDFNKTIEALGGKLLYSKSGSTGHTFRCLS